MCMYVYACVYTFVVGHTPSVRWQYIEGSQQDTHKPPKNTPTDKNMTQSVGHATVPPMKLHSHEDEHRITFNYSIPHVMNLPGGACVECVVLLPGIFVRWIVVCVLTDPHTTAPPASTPTPTSQHPKHQHPPNKTGADLVRHVLNKEASFFYTVSRIPVKVRALGALFWVM